MIEALYELLVFAIPIFIVVILVQLYQVKKSLEELHKGKDPNVEALKVLQEQELISTSEMKQFIADYEKEKEMQRLIDMEQNGIITTKKYKQILEKMKKKQEALTDKSLIAIREIFSDDVVATPEQKESSWRCVCGTNNYNEDTNCSTCHRNKEYIFEQWKTKQME